MTPMVVNCSPPSKVNVCRLLFISGLVILEMCRAPVADLNAVLSREDACLPAQHSSYSLENRRPYSFSSESIDVKIPFGRT